MASSLSSKTMSRPNRSPDLVVNLSLTARRSDGSPKVITSGYRPLYEVQQGSWSSAHHELADANRIVTGQQGRAEVWLLSPEAYPKTFWNGRIVQIAEGPIIVGEVEILEVLNPALDSRVDV